MMPLLEYKPCREPSNKGKLVGQKPPLKINGLDLVSHGCNSLAAEANRGRVILEPASNAAGLQLCVVRQSRSGPLSSVRSVASATSARPGLSPVQAFQPRCDAAIWSS